DPRPVAVAQIQHGDAAPEAVARARRARAREAVEVPAREMTCRVAAEREERQRDDIGEQDEGADTHARFERTGAGAEGERAAGVVPQEAEHDRREVEEVAMHVLQYQREGALAAVAAARAGDGARRRRQEERAVVRLAVVVTGEPQAARRPE